MDCSSEYWQVAMDTQDRETQYWHAYMKLTSCLLDLQTPHATFHRRMQLVLAGVDWKTCLVFLNDNIVYSRTFEQHIKVMKQVFTGLRGAGLRLKPSKGRMFGQSVVFLGHHPNNVCYQIRNYSEG